MDPCGRIYEDDPDSISAEDKARLDGYLHARAEADQRALVEERLARLEELEGTTVLPPRLGTHYSIEDILP